MAANAIRNKDGIWINTSVFKEEAAHFLKYGYYCADGPKTYAGRDYWEEQARRCQQGYEVGGARVTGDHYGYLNFSQMKLTDINALKKGDIPGVTDQASKGAKKIVTFPAFWDGDHDYYWNLEIARYGCTSEFLESLQLTNIPLVLTGGKYMCVGKSRRKGFSYKNGWAVAKRYTFEPNSYSIIGAFDKKFLFPEGTMGMFNSYVSFLDEHTPWGKKRDFVNKIDHKKASYEVLQNGIKIEKGYKSQVQALSFKDNPDAARGKDGTLILLEEAGKFPNLKDSFKAIDPAFRDGSIVTGQIIIFGTGSGAKDKEADWEDFSEIFYNPEQYNMLSYDNVFDDGAEDSSISYFFPDKRNLVGNDPHDEKNRPFVDAQGNSDLERSARFRYKERQALIKGSAVGAAAANGHIQEYPNKPAEAFLVSNNNIFPVVELQRHRNKLVNDKGLLSTLAYPIRLWRDTDTREVKYEQVADAQPIWHWKPQVKDISGIPVMFEVPIPDAPDGTYIGGYDPKRQDETAESDSLHCTYIEKGANDFSYTSNTLVAMYIGNPQRKSQYLSTQSLLLELFNAKLMHENEDPEIRNWYRRNKKLHQLMAQPQQVINASVQHSKVNRIWGMHLTDPLIEAGLEYINETLIEEVNFVGDGKPILGLQTIPDPGLCEELMKYNRAKDKKGTANYDRIRAYMQIKFARQNEVLDKVWSANTKDDIITQLINMGDTQFSNDL